LFFQSFSAQKDPVLAQKGFVDLSVVDLQDKVVALDGEWEFYWQQLIEPKYFGSYPVGYGELPGFWKNYADEYPKFGYATYRLSIFLNEEQQDLNLGLRLNNIHSSYKLWFNGVLLCEVGKVGKSKAESIPKWVPQHVQLTNLQEENTIVIQVSSFRHRNGGIQDPIEIGNFEYFETVSRHQFSSELFLGGACFILSCFFIGMFFFWRKDRATLHFGLFSLFFGSRVLLVGARSLAATFPDLSWDFCIRLEYVGIFAMHYFMFHFIYYAFPNQTSRVYRNVLKWLTPVLLLLCFVPGDFFTYLTIPNNYYLILTFGYSTFIFIQALRAKVPGSAWAVLSMIIFFVTTIPILLEYSNLFVTNPLVLSLCYLAFMLSISLVFASRFGSLFSDLETISQIEKKKSLEISEQKESIEKRNQLINDSINYAERIQHSMLPSEKKLQSYFKECFLFYKPHGTVSGDFYWFHPTSNQNESFIAVADCTGHGVPGAFMSLIAISALDNIVKRNPNITTTKILNDLNSTIHNRLQKNNDDIAVVKDGLDIILCKINMELKSITWSSAHHKLFVIKASGETEMFSGDKHHIGSIFKDNFTFNESTLELSKGDQIYMFSDGIYDQKGGTAGKKLYMKRLSELLVGVNKLPFEQQKKAVTQFVEEWIGDGVQMDDMLLFSIRF